MKKIVAVFIGFVFLISGCTSGTSKDDYISMKEAKDFALKEVDGEVVSESKDLKDDTPHYSFEIISDNQKFDLEIDAKNGDVLSVEVDEDYKVDSAVTHAVSEADAQKVAMDVAGGGEVVKAKLDHKDGHVNCVWDIEVVNGNDKYEIEVNAETKEIVSEEMSNVND